MDELQAVAERMMRAELALLPDGVHAFTDWIDGVGEDPTPIPISVQVEIAGDEVRIDFEGTSPQVEASVNCPVGMVYAACYCAIRGIVGGEIPNCEGYMAPIRINAPAGTVVNPVLPAACGARGVIGYRVYDALMGALAPLVPDRVLAAGEGGPTLIAWGGYQREHDEELKPFGTTEVLVGTWGARSQRDGLEGVSNPLANLGNQPVELLEADLPITVERYGLVADTGGAGRHRGGLAYVRAYRVLCHRATLTIRTDRRDHPPYGLDGGEPGAASSNVVVSGGQDPRAADHADGGVHTVRGGSLHARLGRRRRVRLTARTRPRRGSRRRRGRQGVGRGGPRELRRRDRRGSGRRGGHVGTASHAMTVDLAIRNGLVVDGTGAEPVVADVGLSGGRVAVVGHVPEAAEEIDADGKSQHRKILSPP